MHHMTLAILFIFGSALLASSYADAAGRPTPNVALDIYAKPATLVDIGHGRHLNLRCTGAGTPTVLLESGATADSMAWSKVQPLVARWTRVCAYDRAGYGFSDAGPLPRDVDAAVTDLHALARGAHMAQPMILVGHSLGSNIVRRYAQRFPTEVAGLVLVDPPPQHIAEFSADWVKTDDAMRVAGQAFYRSCEKGAQQHQLDAPTPALKSCLRGPDPAYSKALNAAIHKNKSRPAFWRAVISATASNGDLFAEPVSPTEKYGALPLIVLTADAAYADAPQADRKILEAAQNATHARIVATSARGERIHVVGASHDVQIDRPDSVAAAVTTMIKRVASVPAAMRLLP